MEVKTKYTIGESVIVKHYPKKLSRVYDVDEQDWKERDGETVDPATVRSNEFIWIPCVVEEIHISEGFGQSRFRHDVKYKLRSNYPLRYRWEVSSITLYGAEGEEIPWMKDTLIPVQKPNGILKEAGEDKWFSEDDVFKDMEHAIRRAEIKKLLPKHVR